MKNKTIERMCVLRHCTCLWKGAGPGEHQDDKRLHPVLEELW